MNPRKKALEVAMKSRLEEARRTCKSAEAEGRNLTRDEKRAVDKAVEVAEAYKQEIAAIDDVEAKSASIDELLGTPGGEGGGLYAAFKAAGWAPGKRVSVPASHLKTASFSGDVDDLSPIRREGAALGFDRRYLADVFPATPIDGTTTSVQVLRQASRTLPAPADVQRGLLETTEKAEVASARELVDATVGMLAAKEKDIPNVLLAQDGVRSMVDTDLRLAILEAKDDSIMDAIAAANPAPAGTSGIDLTERIVFAAAEMAEDGYAGTVVAVSPTDYAELSLLRGADEQFARSDPLAGFRFAQSKSITDPLLIAPAAAGHRYEGPLSLQSFEQNDGSTNTSLVRLEQSFLFNVERIDAIRTIGPAGS